LRARSRSGMDPAKCGQCFAYNICKAENAMTASAKMTRRVVGCEFRLGERGPE
jgi:hypothetical protein